MSDLKKVWKQTAKSFVLAFNDLGVSVFDTAKAGYNAAVDWAKKDNPHVEAEAKEVDADNDCSDPQDGANNENEPVA